MGAHVLVMSLCHHEHSDLVQLQHLMGSFFAHVTPFHQVSWKSGQ